MTRRDFSSRAIDPKTARKWRDQNASHRTAVGYVLDHIVQDDSGCWLWQGAKNGHGYAVTNFWQYGKQLAHRLTWLMFRGAIPDGLTLDHLCRVRHCTNPDHLEPVTNRENLSRSPIHHMNRTHCKRGHPYDAANTMHRPSGARACRECYRTVYDVRRGRRAA